MSAILAIARLEFLIARRNLWVASAILMMAAFAGALTFAGGGGAALGVSPTTVALASITTLIVYLAPLLALLLSFDAVAGERERGGLALTLSHPISRGAFLIGKFAAHLAVLGLAFAAGLAVAGGLIVWRSGLEGLEIAPLLKLFASALALGAAFLGLGYLISSLFAHGSAAAGAAVALWLFAVVLYDVALLGALVADDGGFFTRTVFPWALAANPADAFRVVNMAGVEAEALKSGLAAAGAAAGGAPLAALLIWPVGALLLAYGRFRKVEP